MEQLIFIAVLILFSVLDAVAKKKRQGQVEEAGGEDGEAWTGEAGWEPPGGADPERDGPGREPLPRYTGPWGTEVDTAPPSSEGMVPSDIWEEIGALARGERLPEPGPQPGSEPRDVAPEPDLPPRVPSTSPIRRSQVGVREVGSHPVHLAHAEYGTDPSERTPVRARRRGGPSEEVRAVRRALVEGGAAEARKAVILHEVLGKPLAYREDGPGA